MAIEPERAAEILGEMAQGFEREARRHWRADSILAHARAAAAAEEAAALRAGAAALSWEQYLGG